jgi:hypothetical protein
MGSLPDWLEDLKQADPAGYTALQRYFTETDDEPLPELESVIPSEPATVQEDWTTQAPPSYEVSPSMPSTESLVTYPVEQGVQGQGLHQQGISLGGG